MVKFKATTFLNDDELIRRMQKAQMTVQEALEEAVIRDTNRYVPANTGKLARSASSHKYAKLGSGQIVYRASKPGQSQSYARYLWFGRLMVSPTTHSPWAKAGEKKILTGRVLNFQRNYHAKATARWFDVSKKQNMNAWEKLAKQKFSATWGRLV